MSELVLMFLIWRDDWRSAKAHREWMRRARQREQQMLELANRPATQNREEN